jgi:hypothetical protein
VTVDWDALVIGPVFGVFAEPATYLPNKGAPFAITGVFDREYEGVNVIDQLDAAASSKPVLGVRLSQFPAPPRTNDKVQIPSVGATYVVKNVKPDGHGHAVLELNVASRP